jgi:uncharacterized protein (DUF697 family)
MQESQTDRHKHNESDNEESLRKKLKKASQEAKELGGLDAFKSGEWLLKLVQKSFSNYWKRGNADYFRAKYGTEDPDFIAKKLTSVAARNAGIVGAITGAAMSIDEIVAVIEALAAPATGGGSTVPLPAEIAIAVAALCGEAVLLVRIQLQLVANIGRAYGVRLDPEDPEDILTILAFAVGGAAAEEAGKLGMKIGRRLAEAAVKGAVKRETLQALKRIGSRLGVKILQRTIVKYVVPLASIGIGTTWNYLSTRAVGKLAQEHFLARRDQEAHGAAVTDTK